MKTLLYVLLCCSHSILIVLVLFECGSSKEVAEAGLPFFLTAETKDSIQLPEDEGIVFLRIRHQIHGLPERMLLENLEYTPYIFAFFPLHPQSNSVYFQLKKGFYHFSKVFYKQLFPTDAAIDDTLGDRFVFNRFEVIAQQASYLGDLVFEDNRPEGLSASDPIQMLEVMVHLEDHYDEAFECYISGFPNTAQHYPLQRKLMLLGEDNAVQYFMHDSF